MGIFNDFKKMYEEMDDEIPQFNPYNPTYIKDRIRVLKENPVRNRFKVGVAVRMTEIDERHQPINVTECYLLGELCMNRHPQFYLAPRKCKNYIMFCGDAVVSGGRNYVRDESVEVEIMYEVDGDYKRGWFRIECID